MVGYLINLAIPRGGEVSRCYNLMKLEQHACGGFIRYRSRGATQ